MGGRHVSSDELALVEERIAQAESRLTADLIALEQLSLLHPARDVLIETIRIRTDRIETLRTRRKLMLKYRG